MQRPYTCKMDSDKKENFSLYELNDQKAMENIGGLFFVGTLMIVGFIGNSHSVYIYFFKYKSSSYRVFVLCLALIDVLACCITMPFVLYVQRYPLMFQNGPVCKIMKMTSYFITLGSGVILLIIAAERYRKVCVPYGSQILEKTAKISCVVGFTVSLVFSWPALVLYGSKSMETGVANMTAYACEVSDAFWGTPYPTIFKSVLLFVFMVSSIALSIIYSLVWREITRRRHFRGSATSFSLTTRRNQLEASVTSERQLEDTDGHFEPDESSSVQNNEWNDHENIGSDHETVNRRPNCEAKTSRKKTSKKADTITLVLFMITTLFCVSFLPHLVLRILVFQNTSFVEELSFGERIMYNTLRWSFFINHVANPIIYGLFDQKFRSELKSMYKRLRYCSSSSEKISISSN